MSLNFNDIKSEALKRTGDKDGDEHTDADIERVLNFILDDICRQTKILVKHTALDYTLNQNNIILPDDFIKDLLFFFDGIPIGHKLPLNWNPTSAFAGINKTTGDPRQFYILNKILRVYPAPDTAEDTTLINNIGGISATDTEIAVDDVSGFHTRGIVKIENELIEYNGIDTTNNVLQNCTRGFGLTAAAAHADDTPVTEKLFTAIYVAKHPIVTAAANDPIIIPEGYAQTIINGVVKYLFMAQGRETETQIANSMYQDGLKWIAKEAAERNSKILSVVKVVTTQPRVFGRDPLKFRI